MSIPVEVGDVARALEDFDRGYLLTTADARVKAVSVRAVAHDGALVVSGPGRGSIANIGTNPSVTLLFPPRQEGGLSLLVDGTATVEGDDARITPTGAVLHRAVP